MFSGSDCDLYDFDDDDFDTILASDVVFTGKIRFAKPFMVRGKVSGTIEATSDLVVDAGALVRANISAERVLIRGAVEGDISAQLVSITETGSLNGNLATREIMLERGSCLNGNCTVARIAERPVSSESHNGLKRKHG
ncbi:bactofilin family protein [Treponema endosymbiont of Eucomonympha sp.]|uniref:bactofilin family protein n=1 Tax=Treponema endosymbiont of Eucomonympha sp. TaxID=1580831 RepID=UPI000750895D|nr:polymer-forming cytoskeletal protein [Treponema endosymbiont of Eucomonympha sp.]